MSGLGGVVWRDERLAVATDAMALLCRMSHRRGSAVVVARGSVAMGCLDEACAQSLSADQTPGDPEIDVMIDGRIDNDDELAHQLDLPVHATDREIVRRAWRKWGRDCPAHFVGEFAFTVLHDGRVFAARDCAPFRALYYRSTATSTCWASELAPLIESEAATVNEGMVAEYLADRITTIDETLFVGVFRLPPAHAMEIAPDGSVHVWRYWSPDPRAEIRYARQDDYDEHFRALFREAVRCRLSASQRAALWYSGGVDSTAVAAQIAALRDEGEPTIAREIETMSIAASGYAIDESPYFSRGAAHLGLPTLVEPFYFGVEKEFDEAARVSADVPPTPSMMGGRRGWHLMAERQVDTSLTGLGGDDWFIGSQFAIVDDILALRWRAAAARWNAERQQPFGFTAAQLVKLGIWRCLPSPARRHARRALGWRATPPHVAPALASRVSLEERLREVPTPVPFATLAQQQLYEGATSASAVVTAETYARTAARAGIDTRHPFHDRRLVEFALALPADQLLRPRVPRHIVLSAVLSRIPRSSYNSVEGADYAPVIRDALVGLGIRRRIETALSELPAWLEPLRVREALCQIDAPHAAGGARQISLLWQAFAIHAWWKAIHRPRGQTTLKMHEVRDEGAPLPQPSR